MIKKHEIIKSACLTEKTTDLSTNFNKYSFIVAPGSTKPQIAAAIESAFNVKVKKVNTLNKPAKARKSRTHRNVHGKRKISKAIVSLREGDKIELI